MWLPPSLFDRSISYSNFEWIIGLRRRLIADFEKIVVIAIAIFAEKLWHSRLARYCRFSKDRSRSMATRDRTEGQLRH